MSIENSDVELGKAIYRGGMAGTGRSGGNGYLGNVAQMGGAALSDSAGGRVLVDMGGQTVAASQGVDLPCTVSVRRGDACIITLVNDAPTVTGVVGRGDQQQDEINKAAQKATQAQADAKASLTAADLAKQVSDAAKAQAQAAQDAAKHTQDLAEDNAKKVAETTKTAQDAQAKAAQATKDVDAASKAAQAALERAASAQQTADGKNSIDHAKEEPTGDHAKGDQWWVLDDVGHVVGVRVWTGAQWVPYKLVVDELAVPSSVGTVSIKDGAISGDKLQVNSVQAKNITSGAITADKVAAGAVTTGKLDMAQMTGDSAYLASLVGAIIKTGAMVAGDPSKAHVVVDGSGLTFYGNDGRTVKMQLQTATGDMIMSGYVTSGDLSKVSASQIVDITRHYYNSTSSTALEGDSWSTAYPGWADKRYIWVRDDTTYGDGRTVKGTPVMLTGNTGATGPRGDAGTPGRDGADGQDGRMLYGTCSTLAATAAKAVGVPGVTSLYAGLTVSVTFSERNAADACTLDVSNTGAKPLYAWGEQLKKGRSWVANVPVLCVYDGSKWLVDSGSIAATATMPTSDGLYIWRYNSAGVANQLYTLMTGSAMQVHGKSGMVAQFADKRIDLGRGSYDSTISMCNDSMRIYTKVTTGRDGSKSYSSYYLSNADTGAHGSASSINLGFSRFSADPTKDEPVDSGYLSLGVSARSASVCHIGADFVDINGTTMCRMETLVKSGGWRAYAYNGVVYVYVANVSTGSGAASWDIVSCPTKLAAAYRPSFTVEAPCVTNNGASWTGKLIVEPSGRIAVLNTGNAGSADARGGCLSYPIGV